MNQLFIGALNFSPYITFRHGFTRSQSVTLHDAPYTLVEGLRYLNCPVVYFQYEGQVFKSVAVFEKLEWYKSFQSRERNVMNSSAEYFLRFPDFRSLNLYIRDIQGLER